MPGKFVGLFFSPLSMEIVENLFLRQSPLSKERAGGEALRGLFHLLVPFTILFQLLSDAL